MRVLIVDDNITKSQDIKSSIERRLLCDCEFEFVSNAVDAFEILQHNYFDVVILDLVLPRRESEDPAKEGGVQLLREIDRMSQRPGCVIGLTAFDDVFESQKDKFQNILFSVLRYDSDSQDWALPIADRIRFASSSKNEHSTNKSGEGYIMNKTTEYDFSEYNVVVYSALKEESDYFSRLNGFEEHDQISIESGISATLGCLHGRFIVVASADEMGLTDTAIATTLINQIVKPDYFFMIGICGGLKEEVDLGDVVIPDKSIHYRFGAVREKGLDKVSKEENPSRKILRKAKREISNDVILQIIGEIDSGITRPKTMSKVHFSPMGSADLVVKDPDVLSSLTSTDRKSAAVDMESYSFFRTKDFFDSPPSMLVIKSVTDHADKEKDDSIREFCIRMSVHVAAKIISKL